MSRASRFQRGDLVMAPPSDLIGLVDSILFSGEICVQWGAKKERFKQENLLFSPEFSTQTISYIKGNLLNGKGIRLGRNRTVVSIDRYGKLPLAL